MTDTAQAAIIAAHLQAHKAACELCSAPAARRLPACTRRKQLERLLRAAQHLVQASSRA